MDRKLNILIIAGIAAVAVLVAVYLYPVNEEVEVTELTLVRTGGIIGLNEEIVIRADGSTSYTSNYYGDADLVIDETEVADLFMKTNFFTADKVYIAKSGVADFFIYRLTVQTGLDVKTIEWVDSWASRETQPSELGEIQIQLESIIERTREPAGVPDDPQQRAISIAEDFIVQAPTFKFDGILDTLNVVDAVTLEIFPEQHIITITFDSSHAGYGDREGQVLAQVITSHTAKVTVVEDNVVSAIIDEEWDELNQETIPHETIIKAELIRDLVIVYLNTTHPEISEYLYSITWSGNRTTPEGILGHETYVYVGGDWTITIEWDVVAPEDLVYNIISMHPSGIVWTGEVWGDEITETRFEVMADSAGVS